MEVKHAGMKKIDPTVLRETVYVLAWTLVLSGLMQAVFLIGSWWDVTVMFGNLLGGSVAVLHFFLLGLTVQNAIGKDEKDIKNSMKLSLTLRNFMVIAAAAVAFLIPDAFNIIAMLVSLLFPSIAVKLRPMFMKKDEKAGDATDE